MDYNTADALIVIAFLLVVGFYPLSRLFNKILNNIHKKSGRTYYPSFAFLILLSFVIHFVTHIVFSILIFRYYYIWNLLIDLCVGSLLTYVGFLPYLIANKKNHPQTRAIYILNLFTSWTVIIWLVALVWANTNPRPNVIQQASQSSADEIKKLKELADSGVISQEEFEQTKSRLLNL